MKLITVLFLSFFAISAFADSKELILQDDCGNANVGYNTRHKAMTSVREDDSRIKLLITLEDGSLDSLSYSEVKTGVIPTLTKIGNQVVHTPTGVVCAEYKGSKSSADRELLLKSKCDITSEDVKSKVLDQDNFETVEVCQRSYYLNVETK